MKKNTLFILLIVFVQSIIGQNTSVDCNGGPLSQSYCYDNSDTTEFEYTSSDGSALNLTIDSGQIEDGWDVIVVTDSDGSIIYEGDNGGDLAGLTFQSTGDTITFGFVTDSSVSCAGGTTELADGIDWTVACATCVNPSVDFQIVSDCLNAPQFYIDVNVTDMGSASVLVTDDNQGNGHEFNGVGTYQFGPYANGTDVEISVIDHDDPNCFVNSGPLTQEFCSITSVDCNTGPVSSSYCYDNSDTTEFEYVSSDGSALNLTIDSGQIEAGYDVIVVTDSDGSILYQGDNGGDLAGLTFQSTGDTITFGFVTDSSVSCAGGTTTLAGGIDWTVACATCINPSVDFEIVSDCLNAPQFYIDIIVNNMGSASILSTNDNQGNGSEIDNEGIYQYGPYANGTDVEITIIDHDDPNCFVYSGPLTQGTCALITSSTQYTVEELITEVLIDSECNQTSNISFSTGINFGEEQNGIGYFESNGSSWPFESGLIMSTGDVNLAGGPETGVISGYAGNWPGDGDLESEIAGLGNDSTNNASIIEFDFVPVANQMSFDFIFASEEYGIYQCTFADAFAFLLTDSAGITTNLAVVPGTDDPISVLTIRDGQYNSSCGSENVEYFGNYYGGGGLAPNTSPTNFLGHTEVLTAQANVIPNELYTIKLVIADYIDTILDSAVFIDAGSFDIGQLDLGEDILLSSGNALCGGVDGQEIILDAGALPNNSTIEWYMDGNLIEGENGITISVNETGYYTATISIDNTDCAYSDDILIEFFPSPNLSSPIDGNIIKCANESYMLEVDVTNISEMNSITYIWSLNGDELQNGPDNTYLLDENAEQSGEFVVTAYDNITYCWSEIIIQVDFYENSYCIDLPQGLSPNGDGYNDYLILDHLEDREDIDKIEVFNRYGTKVFELNEYVDQWGGTDQDNKKLPVGTYFYIIYFNSNKEPITSWIYLNY